MKAGYGVKKKKSHKKKGKGKKDEDEVMADAAPSEAGDMVEGNNQPQATKEGTAKERQARRMELKQKLKVKVSEGEGHRCQRACQRAEFRDV